MVVSTAALLALHLATPDADAAPKRITGKLTGPDATVIALAESGEPESERTERGRFDLEPPAKKVTLHLRAGDGTYGGPIVVRKEGKRRAITGLQAGAELGKVAVKPGKGYAKVSGRLPEKVLDESRFARANNGVPIGAGSFGLVRSKPEGDVLGDLDLDGVPDTLDIDDDGDLILDNVDHSTARAARGAETETSFHVRSVLATPLWESANAYATNLGTEDIDRTLRTWGREIFEIVPGDLAELDCEGEPDLGNPEGWSGGRPYCTRGGTGRVVINDPNTALWPAFPGPAGGQFDADGDGFGTLVHGDPNAPGAAFFLAHGASSAEIGTGDLLFQRVTTGTSEAEFTALLPFVFATTPVLVGYSDGQGNAGTLSYPVAGPNPGPGQGGGGPGTDDDPFPVRAGPGGEVIVTLTFWRPQRRPIGAETGAWTDIGELTYSAAPIIAGQASCPQAAFSESDDDLEPVPPEVPVPYAPGAGGLRDLAKDRPANPADPANPANTLTYTLNLTQCLRGMPWNPNEAISFNFGAVDSGTTGNVSVTETVPGVTFELQQ